MAQNSENAQLKKNSIMSALSLFFQSGYSAVLGLFTNIVLTVIVTPKVYGIYSIATAFIPILSYFSDIGLAASLIQKTEINDDDTMTAFTIQQILIITAIGIGFLFTSFIMRFYDLPQTAQYLYWALLLSFFISSLKTIPSIYLERKIQFQKIVLVQAVENTVFYIIVSVAAIMGYGLTSFTFGVLGRAITGLIVMYSISFWRPRIGIARHSLKALLTFGVPFQASSFLALFKDDLTTLFLGKALGLEAVGYISWAKKWAEAPIRIIMDNLSRVMFPIFSRLQTDTKRIGGLVEKILYYQTLLLAPALVGVALILPNFVHLIPKYIKWEPALPLLYLFIVSAFLSTYSTPFINLFNALGKAKIPFKLMVYWTLATWVLTPILTYYLGWFGFPITLVFLSMTIVYIVPLAKKYIEFNFFKAVTPAIVCAAIMGVILFGITEALGISWISTIIAVMAGGLSYLVALMTIYRINPVQELHDLFKYE